MAVVKLLQSSPTRIDVSGLEASALQQLQQQLTYHDKRVDHEVLRLQRNASYWQGQWGPDEFQEHLRELRAQAKKTLLRQDPQGNYFCYSGLAERLQNLLHETVEKAPACLQEKTSPWEWAEEPPRLRPYQVEAVEALLRAGHGAVEIGCHGRGQRILMFNGSLKEVQDVVVGDLLMGPDSRPRRVLELCRGRDSIYRVRTVNGQVMVVNGHHLLSLRRTKRRNRSEALIQKKSRTYRGDNPEVIISVNDYINQTEKFRFLYKMYGTGVTFPHRRVPIDPYFLGVLLGDGSIQTGVGVTTADREIELECERQARAWGLSLVRMKRGGSNKASTFHLARTDHRKANPIFCELRRLGLAGKSCEGKFVPETYKFNDFDTRAAVLAGLIDTDGGYSGGCWDYVSKSRQLAEDVAYLARSLGLRVRGPSACLKGCQTGAVGEYFRLCISGDGASIPVRLPRKRMGVRKQKENPLTFGFTVEKVSDDDDFYGFILDDDHLYLTDTFLVTHNTGLGKSFIALELARRRAQRTLLMAPSTNIAEQLYGTVARHLGSERVGRYYDGHHEFGDVVVGNAQSLTRVKPDTEAWNWFAGVRTFIADESHLCPADTLAKVCLGLVANAPSRFFFSGTQLRADGLGLLLEAIIGSVVYSMTVQEGVERGWLSRPTFFMLQTRSRSPYQSQDAQRMNRVHLLTNPDVIAVAADIANNSVACGSPVLILIDEFEQFRLLLPRLRHGPVAFAHGPLSRETKAEVPEPYRDSNTKALVDGFNGGRYPILIGTSAISTGTDVQAVKSLVYLRGGISEVEVRQAVGRGTRKTPVKDAFAFFDFRVENVPMLDRHAKQRLRYYRSIYDNVRETVYG